MRRPFHHAGFTIVELLIVVVVIAILAAVTIVAYSGVTTRARVSTAQNSTSQAVTKILAYAVDHAEEYPADIESLGIVDSETITYDYTVDNTASPKVFCVTVKVGTTSYYQNNTDATKPTEGECPAAPVALTCPTGYIVVPGDSRFGTSDFCVMKYEAKNLGGVATSQAAGTPWVSVSVFTATDTAQAACAGCHLITETEWMTIAANVLSVGSNWSGGTVGSGSIYSGHNDTSPDSIQPASVNDSEGYVNTYNNAPSTQRRTLTLTNGEVIWDLAGNAEEWTQGANFGGTQPGLASETYSDWREWNNTQLVWNSLPATSRPSAISGTVAGYTAAQGIGRLDSSYNTMMFGYTRGGAWGFSTSAGVLGLRMQSMAGVSGNAISFRVTR